MSTFQDGVNASEGGEYSLALQILVPLAEQGDIDAASLAGSLLSMHMHRPEEWFDSNDPGFDYDVRRAEEQSDIDEAIKWLTFGSDGGNGPAAHNLAFLYATQPTSVPIDEAHRLAQFYLDRSHEVGCGVCGSMRFNPRSWFDSNDDNPDQPRADDDTIWATAFHKRLFGDPEAKGDQD